MQKSVGLKEFRTDVEKYAGQVRRGGSMLVMKRAKPLFRIVPVEEEGWETLVDFTQFRKNGIPLEELVSRLRAMA